MDWEILVGAVAIAAGVVALTQLHGRSDAFSQILKALIVFFLAACIVLGFRLVFSGHVGSVGRIGAWLGF